MPHRLPALAIVLVFGLVLGCSSDPRTPEERVRAAIALAMEKASTNSQLRFMMVFLLTLIERLSSTSAKLSGSKKK